jgi:hypothetical protein
MPASGDPARFRVHRAKASKPTPEARCVTRSSRWGNPFKAKDYGGDNALVVRMFREALLAGRLPPLPGRQPITCDDVVEHLQGCDLGCYCGPDEPCHADVLLEIANADPR